jgi:putative resolvase
LSDLVVTVVVVEYGDRLTRFGFEVVSVSVSAGGRRIVVLDDAVTGGDVVADVTGVGTLWCARGCGRRSVSRRAANAAGVTVVTGRESG